MVFTSQIVQVLMNDAYLIGERTRFIDSLGSPPGERKIWEDLHVMGTTSSYEHFSKLIEEWVERTTPSLGQLKELLISCGFISAKDSLKNVGDDATIIKINKPSPASPSTSKAISFGVMQPTSFFTGRDDEVQQLAELFLNQCPPKIVVISGMGGQGKTELCRQFIKTLKNMNPTTGLTWLGGDNETNLTTSIVQLAQCLQIPTTIESKPIPLTQLIIQVSDNISGHSSSGWLVVIDNVDEVYPEFKQAADLLVRHGAFVLVTTRRVDVLTGGAKQMKLDVLKEDDAHNLVKKCLNQPPIDQDVHHLCSELGNHVLAIRHAVASINTHQFENRTSYGIKDYLQDFTKDKTLLNDEDNFVDGYEKTIFLIVTQSINAIYDKHGSLGKRAAQLMEILCLVRPDGISVVCLEIFQIILGEASDRATTLESMNVDLHQSLLLLKKYSLIFYDESSLSIHRLVQKVAKCHCGSEAGRTILKTIEPAKSSKDELQQVLHIWEQANTETIKEFPNLPSRIFSRMVDLSLVLELKPFAENNHQLLTKLLGPDDKNTLRMEHKLAVALKENGDYEAALTKFKEVLEKKRRVLGEDDPSTLITASQLADSFYRLNRFKEALECNERVLESKLRVLGSAHRDTMGTRNDMALVLEKLGRIDEALSLYNQVLDWDMKNQGHSHPDTLTTRHNMAVILQVQGQLEEAKKEFEAVLKLRVEVLGVEHAKTLLTKYWLANTLWKLGKREEARKMNQEVLASQEKVLGPNNPKTIRTRGEINKWNSSLS